MAGNQGVAAGSLGVVPVALGAAVQAVEAAQDKAQGGQDEAPVFRNSVLNELPNYLRRSPLPFLVHMSVASIRKPRA